MEPLISVSFTLDSNNTKKAVMQWYFAKNKVKTAAQASVLSVLAVCSLCPVLFSNNNGSATPWFLFAACLIGLAMVFYSPFTDAIDAGRRYEKGAQISVSLFSDRAEIVAGENRTCLELDKSLNVFDLKDFYVICQQERVYPIPKQCMSEEISEKMHGILSETLGDRLIKNHKK